jgi:N-acetylneuraminate synthase/N,N'-diacetyllegionaminate synthase
MIVLAETAGAHVGDPQRLARMIEAAAETGADAVTFQTYRTEAFVNPGHRWFQATREAEIGFDDWREIYRLATARFPLVFPCPLEPASLALYRELGCRRFKVHGTHLHNPLFLAEVAQAADELILETQAASAEDVATALARLSGFSGRIVLVHGYNDYPTPLDDQNLLGIPFLRERFGLPVGFADHTLDTCGVPAMALALGAEILEKHVTLDREARLEEWEVSLNPDELAELVAHVRRLEPSLGCAGKEPSERERAWRTVLLQKLFVARPVAEGETIQAEDVLFLRDADGMTGEAWDQVVGARAVRALAAGEHLRPEDLAA